MDFVVFWLVFVRILCLLWVFLAILTGWEFSGNLRCLGWYNTVFCGFFGWVFGDWLWYVLCFGCFIVFGVTLAFVFVLLEMGGLL